MVDLEVNGLSIFVVAFGAYTAFVGSIGTCVSCMATAKKCTTVFLFFLGIALIFEIALGVALKADKQWAEDFFVGETCGHLNTTKCNQDVKKAEAYFDDHEDMVFYIILGVIGFQLFAALSAICFRRTHVAAYDGLLADDDDEYIRHFDSMEKGREYTDPPLGNLSSRKQTTQSLGKVREFRRARQRTQLMPKS